MTVPSGGASVSATIANGGAAATVTVPAADYLWTTAGGVSSLLTTFQTQLNNNSQGYPQTAAATNAAAGGTWSGAWLCNESSGNLSAVYGGQTLTAANTPAYGITGPRGGIDYAVGFNSLNDGFAAAAAATYDVNGASDLLLAAVVKFDAVTGSDMYIAAKNTFAGTEGFYNLAINATGGARLDIRDVAADGNTRVIIDTAGNMTPATWYLVMGVLERATNTARVAYCELGGATSSISTNTSTATVGSLANATTPFKLGVGAYGTTVSVAAAYIGTGAGAATGLTSTLAAATSAFASAVNASWAVSMSTTTGLVSISWTGYATPTWSLSWTSTDLRDALGFTANISAVTTTQTGTAQARFVWFPDAPLNCDQHPSMAPEETDLRASESPTKFALGLSGNVGYAHENVRWERVPVERIREASATYDNASLEVFFRDAISGLGAHAWGGPCRDLQVWWSNAGTDALLGVDGNDGVGMEGWRAVGVSKFRDIATPSQAGWVGQWNVRFPRLVADG